MESRVQIARGRFHNGYNCAQAVMCTYCELLGISPSDGYRLSEGFGGGIAQSRGTCGALTALVMLAGLKCSDGKDGVGETKMVTYDAIQKMFAEFEAKTGSTLCSKLKWEDTYPCIDCVTDAAVLAEKYLFADLFVQK